jgi:hypothetical protein
MPALIDRIRAEALPVLADGWRWWTGELAQLMPGTMPWDISRTPRADVRPNRDGVEIVRIAGNEGERLTEAKPLLAFNEDNWRETAALLAGHHVRLLLTSPLSHVVTLKLPKAARPYLRTAIPLQLAEHAPLPPDQLDWARADTRVAGDNLVIRVAMARRDVLDAIETGFREHDIPLPSILAEWEDGKAVALRRGQSAGIDLSRPWAWTIAILALTPLLLLAVLHLLVLHNRATVTDLADLARPRLAAERRIRAQADQAHDLNSVLASPPVTSLVEDLADRLPPSSHALTLSGQDDGTVDITLSTTDPDAARTALLGDARFTGMRQVDAAPAPDRSSTVHYQARVR